MQRSAPFFLFVAVSAFHLIAIATDWTAVERPSKLLLMPALLLSVVLAVALDRRPAADRRGILALTLLGGGILASWAGDALLGEPGTTGFLVGLGGFAVAHVLYIALFAGPLRTRRLPWWALGFALWLAVLVATLAPVLGGLLVPVVIYGIVLAGTAATASGTNPITAIGAILFFGSDSLLAFRMFWPDFDWPPASVVIMVLYCAGQGLIAFGAIRQLAERRPAPALDGVDAGESAGADSATVLRLP